MATYKQIIELQAETAKALKQIDKFVAAAEKKVAKLEQKIGKQENILGRGGGRAVSRLDGEKLQGLKVSLKLRRQQQAAVKASLRSQRLEAKQAEVLLTGNLRLNAALQRQAALEQAITRAGTTGQRRERVDAALAEARANKDNIRIQRATNELLVKELQTQREINRTDKDQNARRSRITTDIRKRIGTLEAIGIKESDLNKIIDARDELIRLNDTKQGDAAKAQEARLLRLIKRQEELNKLTIKPGRSAPASPIRGSVTLAGSPRAKAAADKQRLEAARRLSAEEERQNRFAAAGRKLREGAARAEARRAAQKKRELDELDRQEQQINRFAEAGRKLRENAERAAAKRRSEELRRLDKEENDINRALEKRRKLREELARKARNEAKAAAKQRSQKFTDVATGLGFPLLFGGGPGAAIGGLVGGVAGGFGGSIIASAIGAQFDKVGESAKRLADNLKDPVSLLDEMSTAGFIVSDSIKTQVQALQDQGRAADAAELAISELVERLGPAGVANIKKFDEASDKLRDRLATLALTVFSEVIPAVEVFISGLTGLADALLGPKVQRQAAAIDPQAFQQAQIEAAAESSATLFGGSGRRFEELLNIKSAQIVSRAARPATASPEAVQEQERQLNIRNQELAIAKTKLELEQRAQTLTVQQKLDLQTTLTAQETQLTVLKAAGNQHKINLATIENQISGFQRLNQEIERIATISTQIKVDKERLIIAENQNDLTKDTVFTARKGIIDAEYETNLRREANGTLAKGNAEIIKKTQLQNLSNDRADAFKAKTQETNQALAQTLQLLNSISQEQLQAFDLAQSAFELSNGDVESLERANSLIPQRLKIAKEILNREKQIALQGATSVEQEENIKKLYRQKTQNLEDNYNLMKNQNLERIKAIQLEDALAALTDPGAEVRRTVGRQIQDVQARLDTPFGGDEREMLELRIEQTRRAADAQREYDDALTRANEQIASGIPRQVKAGNLAIENATKRKQALDELLPVLDEIEQRELRQQQILERYGFIQQEISTAMSSAITAVVTGTGTVEEAFATMFANIGQAFIKMATEMIAKALIMKALGILGGGFSGGGGFSSTGYYDTNTGLGTAGPNFGLADGGPTKPNGTYLVGERGPELLTMGNQPGYVHRNTSEVMDRYRGGGSGGGAASNVSVNYNVTEINEMRFVTEEQFRAGMTQAARDGARRGEASTFRTLRNSRSNRARVGL